MDKRFVDMGKRLRDFRKAEGITQKAMAEKLSLSPNFYGKVERGESKLPLDKLLQLCEEYDLDADYIIKGTKRNKNVISDLLDDFPEDKLEDVFEIVKHASNLCPPRKE